MPKARTRDIGLLKGRRIRVTRLDNCGRPIYGDNGRATSEGQSSISVTSNVNTTDEVRVTNSAGKTIVFEASVAELAGFSPEIVFGRVDPEMLSMITGQPVRRNAAGEVVGFGIDTKISVANSNFALEVWAGAPSTGAACDDVNATGEYGYVLFPFLSGGVLGDFSVENGGISFTLTGSSSKDGHAWGKGPYDVQLNGAAGSRTPGPLVETVSPTTALIVQLVDVAPPEPEVGTRPLLNRTVPALTSVAAVKGTGNTYTVTPTPAPASTVGVQYDFGDGTWDYVVGGSGVATKTFAGPGVYTIQATTNGSKVVTTTVTVS